MLRIYYMNVSKGCSFVQGQKLDTIILPERMEKIERQRNASSANKQRLISAFMQYGLSKEIGCSIDQVCLSYGMHGKPEVVGTDFSFNLSHSGDYVVMAISDQTVGIDVESKKKDRLHIAKRFFCQEEYDHIVAQANDRDKEQCFLQLWTMKEAAVKYLGTGLQTGFDSFLLQECEKRAAVISRTQFENGEEVWFGTWPEFKEKYCISVCVKDRLEVEQMQLSDFHEITLEEIEYVVTNS